MRLCDFKDEILNLYNDIGQEFAELQVAVKPLFDGAPISRSQAKTMCSQLRECGRLIIDFDGVSWMGQGFAHQLFVVFAKEHPDIKLIPVNMNESVTKMHYHVTAGE